MDVQFMNVKVIYTLNDKDQSPCLHRLPHPRPVNVVTLDDGSRLGAVDLKTCIVEVLKVSPELLPKLKEHDHAVYAYDYSEEDVPTVGQGKLSDILNEDQPEEETKQIVGRVMKNPTALFKKQAAETLELKLKFVALPSDSPLKKRAPRPQQLRLDTGTGTNSFANRLQAAYDRPVRTSPQLPMSSSPAYVPEDFSLFPQSNSPASMSQHELEMFLNSPIPSPVASKAATSLDLSQHMQSRPPSRMSDHAPTPPASVTGIDPRDIGQADEGPSRKRARLEQAPRPRSASAFGTQPRDAPLRRTASTTASIRHFRPHLSGTAPQETSGGNRLPTPRPQRTRNAAPRRMSSMSNLRQAESFEDSTASSPPAATSPENNPSPAFTSSPPLRDFEVYDESQKDDSAFCSSPLPPYDTLDGTTFDLNEFDMAFSDLPDMPTSELDLPVDIQLGSGPPQDSGIGLMSEDQASAALPKAPSQPLQPGMPNERRQSEPSSQHEDLATERRQPQSRQGSVSLPNQKSQMAFAPGEHPLYQQRTTKLAWNSYEPQGGPALYVQTKPSESKSKAASAAAWRNKPPRPAKSAVATPRSMFSTPAPSSPAPQEPSIASQPQQSQQLQGRSQVAWSPAESETSPAQSTEPHVPAHMLLSTTAPVSTPLAAPTPPDATSLPVKGKTSPSNRGRSALAEVSGNAGKVAIPRASTPKPLGPAPTSQDWTPGSKTGGTKRKRAASKAPSKSTKDKETPSGRAEKRAKHAPKPLTNENGERIYCIACGSIESAAWRNLWSKCFPGPESPAQLFKNEDRVHIHANVNALGQPDRNEKGEVKWWTVHKKSLTKDEMESESWFLQKQCNPCGVHFNQTGRLKIPDWQSLAKRDGVPPSMETSIDSQPTQPQGSVSSIQQNDIAAPIDLTAPESSDNLPVGESQSNVSAAEQELYDTSGQQHDQHGINGPALIRDHESKGSSNGSQQQHQQKSSTHEQGSYEIDKENVPPGHSPPTQQTHGATQATSTADAFDGLAHVAGDINMSGSSEDGVAEVVQDGFNDAWIEGFDELLWPGEVEERQLLANGGVLCD